jgi:predicted 2-oxoglutarate/Fe(II)-dependent dioxygenase YbiX
MITVYNDIISKTECDVFIDFYNNNTHLMVETNNDFVYHFNGIYITNNLDSFSFTKRFTNQKNIEKIRIQLVNNKISTIESPHKHSIQYNFVLFLNEEFEGGELIFENIIIKPKLGQLIYFTGNESHYVKKVTNGDRYSLVGMSTSPIEILKSSLI